MWKIFQAEGAPQRGVVAYISNRKFLTGWPYAGLRQLMRNRFDRIEIIDLRGDLRLRPEAVHRDWGSSTFQSERHHHVAFGRRIARGAAGGNPTISNSLD